MLMEYNINGVEHKCTYYCRVTKDALQIITHLVLGNYITNI